MNDWIRQMVSEQRQREQTSAVATLNRDLATKAYDDQIDEFWTSFLKELRDQVEDFNTQVQPGEQIAINTPEPAMIGFRKDGDFGGQFVARLYKNQHRGEVNLLIARSITNIDCPIVVNEDSHSRGLAFKTDKGQLHQPKRAARMLLENYLRWTLGLIDEAPPAGERRIGF